jgi:hypothetical protein
MADVKTSAFMLSSATIMIGRAFVDDVFALTPDKHSVGMVSEVNITMDSSLTELTNGVAQATVDSKRTGLSTAISGNVFEMTAQNFLRAQGITTAATPVKRGILMGSAAGGSTSLSVASDPIPGEATSALTSVGDIPAGSTILIQRGDGETDYIFPTVSSGAATLNAGRYTIPIAGASAVPADMSFLIGARVWIVQPVPVGDIGDDEFFCVKIVGTLSNFDRPVVYIAPKVKMVKGFSAAFNETQYSSMQWELKPHMMSRGEIASGGRLSEIGARRTGRLFVGAGNDSATPGAVVPDATFSTNPSFTPTSGNSDTVFTANDGVIVNGAFAGRRWLLSGTAIGSGATIKTNAAGQLVLEVSALGTNGRVIQYTTAPLTVAAAAAKTLTFRNPPTVQLNEGDSGTKTFTYYIDASEAPTSNLVVPLTFQAGGTDASDYPGGTLPSVTSATILAGQTSVRVDIVTSGDTTVEGNETFNLLLSTPTGWTVGAFTSASGVILNDDVAPSPTVSLTAVDPQNEGNSGVTNYVYTVTRSSTSGAVNVPWAFAAGTTNAADFFGGLPTGGTVALANGVASGTFTIMVQGDVDVESNETFTVSLNPPSGYILGATSSATGTILNDDTVSAIVPFTSAFMTGDSRMDNSGGRGVTTTLSLTYGQTGYSSAGLIQPMLGNKWLWPEGFQRSVGASTTLRMVEANKTASFALTGNTAFDSTANVYDKIFNRGADGRYALRDPGTGAHVFELNSVNDGGGNGYYNQPFTASKSIIHTAADIDANLAAGKVVWLFNGCPSYASAYTMELRTITGNSWTATQTAGFIDGFDYGAPGVVGEFGSTPADYRVMTRKGSNPGQYEYTVDANGNYVAGGTAPTRVWVTHTGGGTLNAITPTSSHIKTMWAWYNSNAANFVYNGNDYGIPGCRYNRDPKRLIIVDTMKWLRADLNDGDVMAAKPGTMDILRLHHNILGAFWISKAVEEAMATAGYAAQPSLDKRPMRNNWPAAMAAGTANPTLTCTLPPSMRMAVPTQLRLGTVVVGLVDTATGNITTAPGATYAITAGNINFATGALTVTFAGTPPNSTRLYCEQDFGDGAGVGGNLILNGMLDMTPLDGSNINFARTGTSTITGIANSEVPVGYTLQSSGNGMNTAIANGTASLTVSSDTTNGYPMFRLSAKGIHSSAIAFTLQQANGPYAALVQPTDKIMAGATLVLEAGSDGWLYGFGGCNVSGTLSIPTTDKTGPNGTFAVTQVSSNGSRLGQNAQSLYVDSALLAANGGQPFKNHYLGPQVQPDVQPTGTGGSFSFSVGANVPFSFKIGIGQYHSRVRNDVT